ncbi:15-hydroxyprostaglandin dehydrogenase [Trichonephila clavipes]|nr:15-hydroxyprostaglandin dehydrogenase [Trichonephila clavipes]
MTQILGNFNSALDHLQLQYMLPHGPALSSLETLCCPEADGPTNLEQPTLNHVQSDTMASAVLVDTTSALKGTNRGSGPAMKESKNDVGSLEQLLLYADEHYLVGKLPLGDHLGKVLHGVEEYHQRNVGPLRFHASQLKRTGYHRL